MDKIINILLGRVTIILIVIVMPISCNNTSNKNRTMKNVEFIPKEFHDVNTDYNLECNRCSPYFNDRSYDINIIRINAPEKIIFRNLDTIKHEQIFPICIFSTISYLRTLKYDSLDQLELHVRCVNSNENESLLTGVVYDTRPLASNPIPPPFQDEVDQLKKKQILEAQQLSDEALNDSEYSSDCLNINLFDYVDLPMESDRYEIWVTHYGLESNHMIVEIIAE